MKRATRSVAAATVIGAAVIAWTTGAVAQPSIQKCVDGAGKVTYQDAPCDSRQKLAGKVERDTSKADPAALQRAADERQRAAALAKARSKAAAEDELQEAELEKPLAPPASFGPATPTEPRYLYLPQPAVVTNPSAKDVTNARSSGTMAVPGIMQSPSACNTPNCRKK